jgi:hypothetical protein
MTYLLDVCWKGIKADYESGRLTPLSYSMDVYCRSMLADMRELTAR